MVVISAHSSSLHFQLRHTDSKMKTLLLLLLMRFVNSAQNHSLVYPLFRYCPNSLNCESVNATIHSDQSREACCGTCSCDETCGQNQLCCLQDENDEYTKISGRECIEPFTGDKKIFYASSGYAVMMFTHCTDTQVDCRYKNDTLNISPVSTSSKTYLNEECAICNNESEFTHWKADVRFTASGIQTDVWEDPETSTIATQIFRPPSGSTHTQCIVTHIKASHVRCSNDNYIRLCNSLKLPFTVYSYTYQNIFCYFCEFHTDDPHCVSRPKQSNVAITMLLDTLIRGEVKESYFSRKNAISDDCPNNYMPHPAKVR